MVYTASIRPRKWTRGQVYGQSDLPPPPIAYQPAPSRFINPQLASRRPSVPDPSWFQGEDVMHMSLKALREIFRDFDPSELPPDLAECLAGNPAAIKAHNAAGRAWEQQVNTKGRAMVATGMSHCSTDATPDHQQHTAAADQSQTTLCPRSSHQPSSDIPRSSSQAHLVLADATPPAETTVHRTESRASRGKRTQADLALQVCTSQLLVNLGDEVNPWEPSVLFPEINTTPNHHINLTVPRNSTEVIKNPLTMTTSPARRPRRTAGKRIGRKKKGDETELDIDPQAFVDVPLQHAEGTELLALIGASQVIIPSHLMLSSQQQQMDFEIGQPSKGPTKKSKQPRPSPQAASPLQDQEDRPMGRAGQEDLNPLDFGPVVIGPVERTVNLDGNEEEDPEDDPYIDRVDYSDEDPLL